MHAHLTRLFILLCMAGALPVWASNGNLPPLACLHSGSGTVYNVGPGQALTSIGDVPWENLTAGDTVRIHHRAAPYREKFLIRRSGTSAQPLVVCGVPGPNGELPVIDGENATTRATLGFRGDPANRLIAQSRGLIHVSWGQGDAWGFKPAHVVIQGLHIRHAFHQYGFTAEDGTTLNYANNAAGIFVERGEDITVRGVTLEGNGNGFFVASGGEEQSLSRRIVLERSRLYGNGTVSVAFDRHHNIYTEAVDTLIQFNAIGPLRAGSGGSALKDRSSGTVVRYNYIEGGARTLDLVEAQEHVPVLPAYRSTFVYGNVLVNGPGGPSNMIHYGGDSGLVDTYRKGTLHFFHNTVVIRANRSDRWRIAIFDAESADEHIDARNNIFFLRASTLGATPSNLSWLRFPAGGSLDLGVNWATPGITRCREDADQAACRVNGEANLIGDAGNDPGFANETDHDFTLRDDAASRNTGGALHPDVLGAGHAVHAEYLAIASGQPRFADGFPDMGAFEKNAVLFRDGFEGVSVARAPSSLPPAKANRSLRRAWKGKGPQGTDNGLIRDCDDADVICVGFTHSRGEKGLVSGSINAAIALAAAGDTIQVAGGTYVENVAVGSFQANIGKPLTLLGGFNPNDPSERDTQQFPSIIDGSGAALPAVQLHVQLQAAQTLTLDGFVLINGTGLGSTWENGFGHGGGIHANLLGDGEIVISHNEIRANRTANILNDNMRGGGIHTHTQNYGGASASVRIEDNHIHDNLAARGAGVHVTGRQAIIQRNRIEANLGHGDHGGGLYVSAHSQVRDNLVLSNQTGVSAGYGWGGGIFIGGVPAELSGNIISDNHAPSIGSGVFWDEGASGSMRNDLIFANRCSNAGVGIYIDGQSQTPPHGGSVVDIDNLTLANHACPGNATVIELERGSTARISNSILWGNSGGIGNQAFWNNTLEVSYSITAHPGIGNFLADPRFADAANGDFHLRSTAGRYTPDGFVNDMVDSPAIDAGNPASGFSLETAPNGGRINLGTYGNTAQASRSPASDTIFRDGFEA